MKVTVVIPNYNGKKYIDNCLRSVYAGTMEANIVVVDNGSCDGSMEFVAESYPKVKLLTLKNNMGFSAAVNCGIEAANTEYIILLNNDTTVKKDFVQKMVEGMEQRPKAFSASAKMLSMHEPDKMDNGGDFYCALGWAVSRGKGKPDMGYDKPIKIFSACAGAAIYRTKLFEEVGLFDEAHFAYLEDVDIGYRARIKGYSNYYIPDAIVYHVGSAVSGSKHNDFKVNLAARNGVYLIYKNMPLVQLLLNLPLLFLGIVIKYNFFVRKKMGKSYADGIKQGIQNCLGRQKNIVQDKENVVINKVPFHVKNIFHYISIQWELWRNLFRLR